MSESLSIRSDGDVPESAPQPRIWRPAAILFLVLSALSGVLYPIVVTQIARLAFPDQATGSIVRASDGTPIGSALIGQEFSLGAPNATARWFWGRPSATGPVPYTALNLTKGTGSSGSNLAATNPALIDNVRSRIEALRAAETAVGVGHASQMPIDLVTSSASGLDPHISPAAAEYQIARVARARGVPENELRRLVALHTRPRTLGILGEPVVNVLTLNRAIESLKQ